MSGVSLLGRRGSPQDKNINSNFGGFNNVSLSTLVPSTIELHLLLTNHSPISTIDGSGLFFFMSEFFFGQTSRNYLIVEFEGVTFFS